MAQQQVKDLEIKEKVTVDQFKLLLKNCLDSLEKNKDFDFTVKGEKCHVPVDAFRTGRLEVEYEIENNEYELEFSLKWR